MEINEFSNSLTRITAGGTGADVLDKLNAPLGQIEDHLNTLSSRLADINTKSAVVRKYVPLSSGVTAGTLVYFNSEAGHSRFEPALAALLATPGSQGESVEAPSARVEGLVISVDTPADSTGTVMGTLLCGGYWESMAVLQNCLGTDAGKPGVYYLSPTTAGKAVRDPGSHLRQPVLSNYGGGKFSMSLFYMAHDSHFHSSCTLQGTWRPVDTLPEGVEEAPADALYWYDGADDSPCSSLGELSKRTTAVFCKGILQHTEDTFTIAGGYLWCKDTEAPEEGTVTLFNHYPFAYNSPVVRSIESTNGSLTVSNRNGVVQLTANDFTGGRSARSALAISAITDNTLLYTPVVSGLAAGPGISIKTEGSGLATVSSTERSGYPVDAYSINHNQTTLTSDGKFLYITFPKGRRSSLVMNVPVTNTDEGTRMRGYAWCCGVGEGASFNVKFYWSPMPTLQSPSSIPQTSQAEGTLQFTGNYGSVTYAETSAYAELEGPGMLSALVEIAGTPSSDVRMLRIGFKLEVEEAEASKVETTEFNNVNAIMNTAEAGARITRYSCVKAVGGKVETCSSRSAEDAGKCIGIAIEDAAPGDNVRYMASGIIQSSSFNFPEGCSLYVGTDGHLTAEDPASSTTARYIHRMGTSVTQAVLQINPYPCIIKE